MRHRYILKPVFWNTDCYVRPAGCTATGGYPKDNGFGHEEWNNSPAMAFVEGDTRYRAFHTEGVGNLRVQDHDGALMIFMYASHDGVQELTGIAGRATCLIPDECRSRRVELVRKLGVDVFWRDAWGTAAVRNAYQDDRAQFLKDWKTDLHWIPNWTCPEDSFLWLKHPVQLNAEALTGKARLNNRFRSFTEISDAQARIVLAAVSQGDRTPRWSRLLELVDGIEMDHQALGTKGADATGETTRQALAAARLGQGRFRMRLLERWKGACAVLGLELTEILRASHIKPWHASTNAERLDPANGLLLAAHLDALFDKGLISFSDDGEMLVSRRVKKAERNALSIPASLRLKPREGERKFLAYHREYVFRR